MEMSQQNSALAQLVSRQQPHEMNQGAGGFQLSQSAMLVGTVAALQEESGQLRNQWKSDVSRLESELSQLRSAAAWALPHLAEAQQQQPAEPSIRLMSGAGLEHSFSTGTLNTAQLENARMQGLLVERLSRERGLDAVLSQGLMPESVGCGGLFARESAQLEAAMNVNSTSREREVDALLRQQRCASGYAQTDGGVMHGVAVERLSREEQQLLTMHRYSSTGNIRDAPGLADAVMSQMHSAANDRRGAASCSSAASCSGAPSERGGAPSGLTQAALAEQASRQAAVQAMEAQKLQMLELYKELEKMTMALQEAQQENSKLKEDKETSETAHARDIHELEGMLQQLSADNDRLNKALTKSEETLTKFYENGGYDPMAVKRSSFPPGTPSSIRSASVEPASEPSQSEHGSERGSAQAEFDRIKFKIGVGTHR